MGRDLILSSPFASSVICRLESYLDELPLAKRPTWSLRGELLAAADVSRLNDAALAQPLCTAVQIMLVDLLQVVQVNFAAVVGHSSGEIAAAYAAGYLSDRDAVTIAYFRGLHSKLSQGPNGEHGAMMAVETTLEDALDLCDFPELQGCISVAAINSSTSITLSGDVDAIRLAKETFEDEGKFARVLNVDKAYHSRHMNSCSDDYVASLIASNIKPQIHPSTGTSWFSSVTGELIRPDCEHLEGLYWNKNMVQPVLFSDAIVRAIETGGPYALAIELGPSPALKRPALQTCTETGLENILYTWMLQREKSAVETISVAFGLLWSHLGERVVDFEAAFSLSKSKPKLLKDLPSYPWDHHQVYWHESQQSKSFRTNATPPHELLGALLPDATQQECRWRNTLSVTEIPWLQHHRLQGVVVFPAAGYVVMALEASKFISTSSVATVEVHNLEIKRPIVFHEEAKGV